MKTFACIAFLTSLLPAVAVAQEFRMDVRDNAFAARYGNIVGTERGQFELSGDALIGKGDRKSLGFGLHAVDNAYTVETPVFVGLGGRVLWLDGGRESGAVVALGANGRMTLPQADRVALSAHAYFAPSITSFGSADSFYEIALRGEYQVLENAWLYGGYRRSDADFDTTPTITLDSGVHIGMRFTF